MKLSQDAKWMFIFLAVAITVGVFDIILQAAGLAFNKSYPSDVVLLALVGLLALHSKWQLGVKRAATFFLLAAVLGLLFEIWGLRGGTFFGGHYVYNGSQVKFWGVPYIIPIYWAVFIYTAYSISNGFRAWLGYRRPSIKLSPLYTIAPILVIDGLLTVALDLIMDPIKVREGSWTWLDHGAYFGVPVGNFVGWFVVTVIVTGIFRLYEYFKPREGVPNTDLLLIPVIGYGLLGIGLGISAAFYGMNTLAVLSAVLILAPATANVVLYLNRKHQVGSPQARL